ncbi:MAG: HAMP domain-containing sensor histidine kinase, partial [Acidobacteriota bacterium]
ETLAKRYLDSRPIAPSRAALQPSGLPDLWHLASPSGTVVGLFEQRRLLEDLDSSTVRRGLPPATSLELLPPGVEPTGSFLVSMPAGGLLQDWSLVLRPEDQALFATAARQQNTATALTGVLVVAVILVLTVLMARVVDRKLRLTRLKNDLLSTVSHELKTPLASMRLLVDTLIDNGVDDRARVREYLHLIAQENSRLSRLVDNFLTFSRLEQQRQHFDREPVAPADVVADAANSVGERFRAAGCRFDVEVEDDLPLVLGDHDALVTVLLNLLDNAFKYSDEDEQRILLCAHRDGNQIGFAVRDHGIGLSRRASGKIFERFYQVDQSLSRPGSGCGLGLSIVRLIVRAHHGTIDVESRLGVGSTFTVRLPATAAIRTTDREDDA